MKDRIPTYPGRVVLTPVPGQPNKYDMVRADEPTEPGSQLSKLTLLKDTTAALLGGDSDMLPDEAIRALAPNPLNYIADLNYFTELGAFSCDEHVVKTNIPPWASPFGVVYNVRGTYLGFLIQHYFDASSRQTWQRTNIHGVWSGWRQSPTTATIQYIANGAQNRTIDLGFIPTVVIIRKITTSVNVESPAYQGQWYDHMTMLFGEGDSVSAYYSANNYTKKATLSGQTVQLASNRSGTSALFNDTGTYRIFAIT